ncbi:hypothetical protein P171DRAFT_488320 [Karstenula rhodostoma CBS 690.94]|uniref:DUF7918 domain-containing protein n=1 Tax=Karstenula rhodostoma CBS 690.94 TaxID=1392251 RepID=A0A9P4PDE3_9PLEO|nr:hypothetical protein P171DRAFT_488320 [Karstenula rhodostoma CBS 690.94]
MEERNVQDPGTVHKKALRGCALSHTLRLDEAGPNEEIDYYDAEYANNGEPFAVFHFYYRSLSKCSWEREYLWQVSSNERYFPSTHHACPTHAQQLPEPPFPITQTQTMPPDSP